MREEVQPGAHVVGKVIWHEVFGLRLRLDRPEVDAVVDRLFVTDSPPQPDDADWWPVVGARVEGVVQGYMPNGQLRVSLRESDEPGN